MNSGVVGFRKSVEFSMFMSFAGEVIIFIEMMVENFKADDILKELAVLVVECL